MAVIRFPRVFFGMVACIFGIIIVVSVIYLKTVNDINKEYDNRYGADSEVALRKFPYPYRAALAISNDIDNTETLEEFIEIHKFINTNEMTSMGAGVGLDIGNSFFFYEPPGSAISYFSEDPKVSETIIRLLKAGDIDCLHSYGKKYDFTRDDAILALQEFKTHNCKVAVWVDHTRSKDNLGDDVTFGLGDHPGSKAYHADLTLAEGIKFAWLGRVTMVVGQSVPITVKTFTDIFDADHPLNSFVNMSKEFAKNVLGVFGNKKYIMHKGNDIVKITDLNDGQKVFEFMRFDNHWKGVGVGADAKGLAYSISSRVLANLKKKEGYMIVYTHLGKNSDSAQFIPTETQNALRNLSAEFEAGNIYVTSTSKLLNYYLHHRYLNWSYKSENTDIIIQIQNIKDPIEGERAPTLKDLQGVTFYVPAEKKPRIFLSGQEVAVIQRNFPDYTGRVSVTLP